MNHRTNSSFPSRAVGRAPIQTINHWALIYVALTGESLAEGGKHVMQLFVVSVCIRPAGLLALWSTVRSPRAILRVYGIQPQQRAALNACFVHSRCADPVPPCRTGDGLL
jgi:hypothetical protein